MVTFYNDKYLAPLLMREPPKSRNHEIVNVFTKLSLKDAMDHLARHGTFTSIDDTSIGRLIRNFSSSNMHSGNGNMHHEDSNPALDMHELDAHFSRKDADDARCHHIVVDAMFQPRKRHKSYERHNLAELENHPPFHHHARLQMRHMVSDKQSKKNSSAAKKAAKKNSVAQMYILDEGKLSPKRSNRDMNRRPVKNVSFFDGVTPAKDTLMVRPVHNGGSVVSSEDEDEDGITFQVKGSMESSLDDPAPPSPTAAERMLPWRQRDGESQVSPIRSHSPKWADNYIHTASPQHLHSPSFLPPEPSAASSAVAAATGVPPPIPPRARTSESEDAGECGDNRSVATESTDVGGGSLTDGKQFSPLVFSSFGGGGAPGFSPEGDAASAFSPDPPASPFSPDEPRPVTFHLTLSDEEEQPLHDSHLDMSSTSQPIGYYDFMRAPAPPPRAEAPRRESFDARRDELFDARRDEASGGAPAQEANGPVMRPPRRRKRNKHGGHHHHHQKQQQQEVNDAYRGVGESVSHAGGIVIELRDNDHLTVQLVDTDDSAGGGRDGPNESNL
ncbi:PREDICTED: sodium/hydrogen exchanger 5-like [Priapulus caudatus]|uniref:Sodium/hydrogen exchanger 5-like n=1 Tax=Priapulus caudatus TaxID=37621 RepID=A0ABM1ERA3_PRICU|nr:PREDICTED: sodium/hydrogen exchanger 5-like [Priapulus caudatus]